MDSLHLLLSISQIDFSSGPNGIWLILVLCPSSLLFLWYLTLQYIHVFSVTLTPTPGGSHPVYTPFNEIIKIIKCDLNWSQCDLRGPSWGSSTITNRLQVLSDVTFTDRKNFHFGDFYFLIFFKYRHDFNTQGGNHPPSRGSFGPAKDLLEDFFISS